MLKERNRDIYDALKLLSLDFVMAINDTIKIGVPIPYIEKLVWVPIGGDLFNQQVKNVPVYSAFVGIDSIKKLTNYPIAVETITTDELWFSHIDSLIGSVLGDVRFELDSFLISVLSSLLEDINSFEFSEVKFDSIVEKVELHFSTTKLDYIRKVPLWGLRLDSEIKLTDTLSLELIDDGTVSELLELGLIINFFNSSILGKVPRVAIVSTVSVDKILTKNSRSNDNELYKEVLDPIANQEAEIIDLFTLILLNSKIKPLGSLTKSNYIFNGTRQFEKKDIVDHYEIVDVKPTQDDIDSFYKIWQLLYCEKRNSFNFLNIAVHRFYLSNLRASEDDRLIDLMISAEAIFLQNGNAELKQRLSQRAALLLGENSEQKKEIFKFFKEAYDMRSKVVHGSESCMHKERQDITTLNHQLSEYLRNAILKMLKLASSSENSKDIINWENLMFLD